MMRITAAVLLAWSLSMSAFAQVQVIDDMGTIVELACPAKKIITLSPAVTENMFAAGAAEKIVATVEYSDYPKQAGKLPRVGSSGYIDLEMVVSLKPDLVVASKKWNRPVHVEKLRSMGIPVYVSAPDTLDDIAAEIERMGKLAGTSPVAMKVAAAYREGLLSLKEKYEQRLQVDTFYQAWKQPLVTVSKKEFVSKIIELCGGRNVFADTKTSVVSVSIESVIVANPEAIVASGMGEARPEWLDDWKRWHSIRAVKNDNLFFIPPDILQRDTVRLLEGAEMLCESLEKARSHRNQVNP